MTLLMPQVWIWTSTYKFLLITGNAAIAANMSIRTQAFNFMGHLQKMRLSYIPARPVWNSPVSSIFSPFTNSLPTTWRRQFSNTPRYAGNWLLPSSPEKKRSRKGRPRVPTGGSSRGTTIVWGDYGLRMCDHHRRVSAAQLKVGEDAIKTRLRGMRYRLYKRVCASIGVYSSGNEVCYAECYKVSVAS